jgi:hypothetical protein
VAAGEGRRPDPPTCSGYSKSLEQVGSCLCCTCWVDFFENAPVVSSNSVIIEGNYKNIEVGIVPVDYWTFFEKVQVEVRQMSLSRAAFNFWKTVGEQKNGSTSLFQPAIGKSTSNISHKNGSDEVQGLFYATSSTKRIIFISPSDIPLGRGIIPLPPPPIPESCLAAFQFSTTEKPITW